MVNTARCNCFRTHVREGAANRPGLRHTTLRGTASKPEIHDSNSQTTAVFTHNHDVFGLDVAMSNTARVTVFEGFGNLNSNVDHLSERQCPIALKPAQISSLDNRHYEKQRTFVFPKIENRHNRRVIHLSYELCFTLEPLLCIRIQERGRNKLDSDIAIE